jgi:nucleoside-diphosphate-sugar epimerase
MIEHPVPGKHFKCYVEEDTKCPILYFKDAALSADLIYQAPKEQIKTMNYNVAGVVPIRTAKDIEQVVKEHVPKARISYNPEQKVMDYFRAARAEEFDDSKAREEWGWLTEYPDFEKVVADFIEEIRVHPDRYGIVREN